MEILGLIAVAMLVGFGLTAGFGLAMLVGGLLDDVVRWLVRRLG
jgi:hypothetical protein